MNTAAIPSASLDSRVKAASMRIAILIPCLNEGPSIAQVVTDFQLALPTATIFVYDNCSTDNTVAEAARAGAIVCSEPWPGKGNVVRRMFADIDADLFVMVDGDGTYDATVAVEMVKRLLKDHLDMVVGIRMNVYEHAHRRGHGFGNLVFNKLYRNLFGPRFTDIFSGYRVFSRRFVKSFPAVSSGFEIETEMSVHASQLRMPIAEIPTKYNSRLKGSTSKLHTFRDAFRILITFVLLFKEISPIRFYGAIAVLLSSSSLIISLPLLMTYIETGLVPRLPTAVLAMGMMLLAAISLVSGVILDSVARGRLEYKRLIYLSMPPANLWNH